MKLAPDATAALTLGPQMGLNKLMQAALRMRQLAKGQRVVLVATPEVARLVAEHCDLEGTAELAARHVLQWALHNTAEHNQNVRMLLVTVLAGGWAACAPLPWLQRIKIRGASS